MSEDEDEDEDENDNDNDNEDGNILFLFLAEVSVIDYNCLYIRQLTTDTPVSGCRWARGR